MGFIKVKDTSGHPIYVNTNHIVTVEQEGDKTRIDLDADAQRDKYLVVTDQLENVMKLIESAEQGGTEA
jgi:uncharacterized protein YlzI (FlbEa/FlbD family)